MPAPVTSTSRHTHQVDVAESLRCAAADRPAQAQRNKRVMVRYLILLAALIAVVLLIAIAVYYTHGNSVAIRHISSLAPQVAVRC